MTEQIIKRPEEAPLMERREAGGSGVSPEKTRSGGGVGRAND